MVGIPRIPTVTLLGKLEARIGVKLEAPTRGSFFETTEAHIGAPPVLEPRGPYWSLDSNMGLELAK